MTVWACWIALYSAVVHGRKTRRTALVVMLLAAVLFGEVVREVFFYGGGAYGDCLSTRPFCSPTTLCPSPFRSCSDWQSGRVRDRERELAARTSELQSEREENARSAVLEERVRIARELHDVVAHHVSVMGVQAGAARRVMAQQPAQGRGGAELDRGLEPPGRARAAPAARLPPPRRPARRAGAAAGPRPAARARRAGRAGRAGGRARRSRASRGRCRRTLEVSAYRVDPGGAHQRPQALGRDERHGARRLPAGRRSRSRCSTTAAATAARGAPSAGTGSWACASASACTAAICARGARPQGGFAVHATFPLNGGAT